MEYKKQKRDSLHDEAKELIKARPKGTTGLIMRHLDLGYSRASTILDMLAEEGYITIAQGNYKLIQNKKQRSLIKYAFFLCILIGVPFAAYIIGNNHGIAKGRELATQEFMTKEVNLVGVYFDQDDNIKLNTFTCTPNDVNGDCSSQILENYKLISDHWLDYCKRVSSAAFNSSIEKAKILRDNLGGVTIPSSTPTAVCNDGTTSYSANQSGTCSSHGGVRYWY